MKKPRKTKFERFTLPKIGAWWKGNDLHLDWRSRRALERIHCDYFDDTSRAFRVASRYLTERTNLANNFAKFAIACGVFGMATGNTHGSKPLAISLALAGLAGLTGYTRISNETDDRLTRISEQSTRALLARGRYWQKISEKENLETLREGIANDVQFFPISRPALPVDRPPEFPDAAVMLGPFFKKSVGPS